MKNSELQKRHIRVFGKLSLSERLDWAFAQRQCLARFMDAEARKLNKKIRRNGKQYFKAPHLA